MTINIQFERVPFNEALIEYVINKLNFLSSSYSALNKARVLFKKESPNAGNGKICEINLSVAGKGITATSSESSYEKALKETTAIIEWQLHKNLTTKSGDHLVGI